MVRVIVFPRLLGRKHRAGDAGHRQAALTPPKGAKNDPSGGHRMASRGSRDGPPSRGGALLAECPPWPSHVSSYCDSGYSWSVPEIRTLYDGLARFPARSAARRDARASQAARDDVRLPPGGIASRALLPFGAKGPKPPSWGPGASGPWQGSPRDGVPWPYSAGAVAAAPVAVSGASPVRSRASRAFAASCWRAHMSA